MILHCRPRGQRKRCPCGRRHPWMPPRSNKLCGNDRGWWQCGNWGATGGPLLGIVATRGRRGRCRQMLPPAPSLLEDARDVGGRRGVIVGRQNALARAVVAVTRRRGIRRPLATAGTSVSAIISGQHKDRWRRLPPTHPLWTALETPVNAYACNGGPSRPHRHH